MVLTITGLQLRTGGEAAFGPLIYGMAGLVTTAPLLVLAPGQVEGSPMEAKTWTTLALSGLGTALAVVVWSLGIVVAVEVQARGLAQGARYCLQVADDSGGYRSVSSRLQLTGLTMQAPIISLGGSEDYQWTYHAMLFVEDVGYRWSYGENGFVPTGVGGAFAYQVCKPRLGFLDGIF